MQKLEKPQKPLMDQLFPLLVMGIIIAAIGLFVTVGATPFALQKDDIWVLVFLGAIVFAIGLGMLIAYFLRVRKEKNN